MMHQVFEDGYQIPIHGGATVYEEDTDHLVGENKNIHPLVWKFQKIDDPNHYRINGIKEITVRGRKFLIWKLGRSLG